MRIGFLGRDIGRQTPAGPAGSTSQVQLQLPGEANSTGKRGRAREPHEVEADFVELPVPGRYGPDSVDADALLDLPSVAQIYATVAGCRAAIADALQSQSKAYQALCALVQSGIPACDQVEGELRRRLEVDIRYAVLGKLDEACAIALASGGADILAGSVR